MYEQPPMYYGGYSPQEMENQRLRTELNDIKAELRQLNGELGKK